MDAVRARAERGVLHAAELLLTVKELSAIHTGEQNDNKTKKVPVPF